MNCSQIAEIHSLSINGSSSGTEWILTLLFRKKQENLRIVGLHLVLHSTHL